MYHFFLSDSLDVCILQHQHQAINFKSVHHHELKFMRDALTKVWLGSVTNFIAYNTSFSQSSDDILAFRQMNLFTAQRGGDLSTTKEENQLSFVRNSHTDSNLFLIYAIFLEKFEVGYVVWVMWLINFIAHMNRIW